MEETTRVSQIVLIHFITFCSCICFISKFILLAYSDDPNSCRFGSPLSPTYGNTNSFLKRINSTREYKSWRDITKYFYTDAIRNNISLNNDNIRTIYNLLRSSVTKSQLNSVNYSMDAPLDYFAIRTCNSFWNPQVTISATNVDPFYLGMASQATEREDTIITPDLRGNVFGPLEYTRRDLMAVNLQRARDHGLPDYNTARTAYGLAPKLKFEEINPLYGIDATVTDNIEGLRAVYNDDIGRCDIWACGLAETIPSDGPLSQLSGPGELFTEVLFDHFMRVRHGDRFWYENANNGLFTPEEVAAIKSLTLKDLIIQTTHIRDSDISDTPFLFEGAKCPQPFQLSELYMDDCTGLEIFDYNVQSVYEIPLVWGFVFLYIFLVISVMLLMAAYNQHVRKKVLASGRRLPKERKIEGDPVASPDGEIIIFTELRAGLKSESRQVSLKFGPGKRIVIYFSGVEHRVIDLRFQTKLTIQIPSDNIHNVTVKITHEYDIILRSNNPLDRNIFTDTLKSYMNSIGVGIEIEEPLNKQMLGMVYTKKDRQTTLEKFFRSLFREGAATGGNEGGEIRGDILECELTKAEFADAMSLKPDSVFVDQMFELIDKDKNGFVSFREFLDMFVIFAKGSPDDKIELMFHMYDIDKSGMLDKVEFKKMLKAMMEMVNTSVNPDQVDQLINSMFASAGFHNKVELTLDDFKILLRDHKEELSSARLQVKGYDVPEVKIESKQKDGSLQIPARYHREHENAPARARRTVIRAYENDRGKALLSKAEDVESNLTSSTIEIPTVKRSAAQTRFRRHYAVFVRYVENHRLQIFYFVLFMLVCAGIFVERGYYYSVETEHAGIRRVTGFGLPMSRGSASAMMFTYSVLLLTMARNFITFLRETIFNYYVPFDSYIEAHKVVALTALFFTIVHAISHALNFYHISTQTANDLSCLFREVYYRTHDLPKFSYWLFLTMTGFAGFMVSLITVIIFAFATQYARRHTYRAFWVTHHWYVIFYILIFLHGSGRLIQDPLFGNFFLGPGIVYALDRLISVGRRTIELTVVRADILPSQVTGIYFKRPVTFDYKAGQWMKIASAAQNPGEFHSFTISSAPHEEHLSLHIRAVGPWTCNLRENYSPATLQGRPYPKVYVDGPFGEGHQDWFRYEVAVLVGGGIGVTPFASILKELVHRFSIGARVECKKVSCTIK